MNRFLYNFVVVIISILFCSNRPVEYNATNSTKATDFQHSLEANLGGTELLPALNAAFRSPLPSDEWCKKVIVLTSGMVSSGQEESDPIASYFLLGFRTDTSGLNSSNT
ncbi:hypothetical protein D915_006241 [Fasciola hepatica]|uniref:Uncharacterized protein n=1 Tax=Fasciola hepatica TaxID=6192 RepID=A0A4E0RP78_FASHE|nr:hypothetical protein D915_006241 [Fasciola hepatica]